MTLFIVRHAHAGDRYQWDGHDADRPISGKGRRQAEALTDALAVQPVTRVLSSRYVRCQQTVAPLASKLGVALELHDALVEGAPAKGSLALARELAAEEAVLCSHGDVIPDLIAALIAEGMAVLGPRRCEKGSVWRIEVEDGRFTTGRYLGRPGEG